MANVLLQGTVNTGAGVAVVGATVEVLDFDTTTVRATFTGGTDADGDWNFSYAPGANPRRVDVRITNGTSISRLKFTDQFQVSSLETANFRIINPAFTFEYDIVPAEITAARQLNLPLLTGTGTPAVLEDVISGGQTFASALTLSAVLTVNANIAFPATQVASAGANTLDDYEEGSWTPVIAFGGASVGVTYSVQAGFYTKIGNRVCVTGRILLTSKGSSVGAAVITGLPFTVRNANGAAAIPSVRLLVVTYANAFMGYAGTDNTTINLEEVTEAGTRTTLADTDFANTSDVIVTMQYEVG